MSRESLVEEGERGEAESAVAETIDASVRWPGVGVPCRRDRAVEARGGSTRLYVHLHRKALASVLKRRVEETTEAEPSDESA